MSIRIGLIGCGVVTQKAHLPALLRDQRFRITAICRRTPGQLEALGWQLPHAKKFTETKELIESGEADCLLVAADVDVHLSMAQMALDNDLYVLLEKPVDSSSENIRKFIKTNQEKVNRVMVAFNKRFYSSLAKLHEMCQAGELSNRIGGTLTFLTQQGRKPGRLGVLQNLIHYCDLVNWLFGKPVSVHSHFSQVLNDERRGKTISSTILTEKGCAVNLFYTSSANWGLPVHERIQILDDKNRQVYIEDTDRMVLTKLNGENEVKSTVFDESNSIFWRRSSFGYEAQVARFGDLIEGKLSQPSPDIHDALNAQVLFEKIFEFDNVR